eukprot:5238751-Prymnesium_polylepis.1
MSPGHASDPPRPTQPTLPHIRRCEERERALLVAPPAQCSSSSRLPARSQASTVSPCGSAQPSRRSSAIFCT